MMQRRTLFCRGMGLVACLLMTAFLALLLDRHDVIDLDQTHSYITPNPVKAGQTVSIVWSAVERRNCEGRVIPRVIDSSGRVFEYARQRTVYHDLMSGSAARSFSKPFTLPVGLAPGRARYEAIVTRWCNPVQQFLWPMVDDPFPIPFDVLPD